MTNSQQRTLGFAEAEGSRAERRNLLGLALIKLQCDAQLSAFLLWVFNATAGGCDGALIKSYDELAARPWGLCCSATKARRTVRAAHHAGLIHVEEQIYSSGGQRANAYSIDWDGVYLYLGIPTPARAPVPTGHPGVLLDQGGVPTDHPPVSTGQALKEEILSLPSLFNDVDGVGENGQTKNDEARAAATIPTILDVEAVRNASKAISETAKRTATVAWCGDALDADARRLIMESAIIAHTVLSVEWLDGAARATGRLAKTSKAGYLRSTLARRCHEWERKCPPEACFDFLSDLLAAARPLTSLVFAHAGKTKTTIYGIAE